MRPCVDRKEDNAMRIWPTKRWWKRLGLSFVILVAIALLANGFMAWRTSARFKRQIAAIRAAGDPASIADLAPTPIPDNENAAAILKKLGLRLDAFSHEYGKFYDTPAGETYDQRQNRGEAPTVEQIAATRAILDKYPDIVAGITSASASGKYASMSDFSVNSGELIAAMLDSLARFRSAARFQEWRMEMLVAEKKQEKAVELGIEMLRLARLYDHEPLLVNRLVGIAVRGMMIDGIYDALAAGPISPKLRAELDSELALHDDPQCVVNVMKTERAFSVSAIAEFGWNPPVGVGHPISSRMFGWVIQRQFLQSLDFYDEVLKLVSQPPSLPLYRRIAHPGAVDISKMDRLVAELTIPAVQAWYDAEMRCVATTRALRIYNALTEYAYKNSHEATGLDDLKLPKEATIDPFDGKPLKLKHAKEGWIVYTVFSDGVDDGGTFIGMKDFGLAPAPLRMTEEPKEASTEMSNEEKAAR